MRLRVSEPVYITMPTALPAATTVLAHSVCSTVSGSSISLPASVYTYTSGCYRKRIAKQNCYYYHYYTSIIPYPAKCSNEIMNIFLWLLGIQLAPYPKNILKTHTLQISLMQQQRITDTTTIKHVSDILLTTKHVATEAKTNHVRG